MPKITRVYLSIVLLLFNSWAIAEDQVSELNGNVCQVEVQEIGETLRDFLSFDQVKTKGKTLIGKLLENSSDYLAVIKDPDHDDWLDAYDVLTELANRLYSHTGKGTSAVTAVDDLGIVIQSETRFKGQVIKAQFISKEFKPDSKLDFKVATIQMKGKSTSFTSISDLAKYLSLCRKNFTFKLEMNPDLAHEVMMVERKNTDRINCEETKSN